jgi:hypothetical protein
LRVKNKFIFCFVSYVIVFVIVYISNTDILELQTKDMLNAIFYFNLYNNFGNAMSIMDLLFSLLPTIIVFSVFADRIAVDIEKNAVYVFTRTNRRAQWMVKKACSLGFQLICVTIVLYIVQLVIYYILGFFIIDFYKFITQSLYLLFITFLTNFGLILFANALIMKLGQLWGYLIAIFVYFISVICMYIIPAGFSGYAYLLPFVQKYSLAGQWQEFYLYFPSWQQFFLRGDYLRGLAVSVIYAFIALFLGIITIRKKEFY